MTVDLRRYAPHVCKHPNRPDPPERIRPKCDVVTYVDGRMSIHLLTRREMEHLWEALNGHPDGTLYAVWYAVGAELGKPLPAYSDECTLDHDAWADYEAIERALSA